MRVSCFEIFLEDVRDLLQDADDSILSHQSLAEVGGYDIVNSVNWEEDLEILFGELNLAFERRKQVIINDSASKSMSTCIVQTQIELESGH